MDTYGWLLDQAPEDLDPAQLLECCKAQRNLISEGSSELNDLRAQLGKRQRVCSFPDSISSIRADIDSPEDVKPFFCFGERPKYPNVIAFKPGHSLEVRDRVELVDTQSELNEEVSVKTTLKKEAGKAGETVIYSRLPAKRGVVYVFVESSAAGSSNSAKRYRLSTQRTAPAGFSEHWTIHLKRLPWFDQCKVMAGKIRWVYVLVPTTRDVSEKSPLLRQSC